MPLVKKLYLFILNTFLPLFLMTFFISLFVLLMQFLWKYVDELVGKGIEVGVLGELFFMRPSPSYLWLFPCRCCWHLS